MEHEIPQFELRHIISVRENIIRDYHYSIHSFIKEEDIKEDSLYEEKNYIFLLNLESFSRKLFNEPIFKEILETKENSLDLIVEGLGGFLSNDYIFEHEELGSTITFTDKNSDLDKSLIVTNLISSINSAIKNKIEQKYGVDLEFYFKEKNEDAQIDLVTDYDHAIKKIFIDLLEKKVGVADSKIILNTTAQLRHYDTVDFPIENEENTTCTLKIIKSKKATSASEEFNINKDIYDSIREHKYVKSLEFIQRNNNSLVRIHATDEAKKIVKDLAEEATQIYLSTSKYKEPNKDKLMSFLSRVNDDKGNDCDILKTKSNGQILVMVKDNEYMTLEKLKEVNNDLFIKVESFLELNPNLNEENNLKSKNTKKSGLKIK